MLYLVWAVVCLLPIELVELALDVTRPLVPFVLVRHGLQPHNIGLPAFRGLSGWLGVALTAVGVLQAILAGIRARWLFAQARRAVVISSDVYRALQTTMGFLAGLGMPVPVVLSPLARERNAGKFNGMTRREAAAAGCTVINEDGSGPIFRSIDASYATPDDDPASPGQSARDVHDAGIELMKRALLFAWLTRRDLVTISTHEVWIKMVRFHLLHGEINDRAFAERVENACGEFHLVSWVGGTVRKVG